MNEHVEPVIKEILKAFFPLARMGWRDLGCANGWPKNYKGHRIVKQCLALGHVPASKMIRPSETRRWCEKCRYEYDVDSSD